MLVALRRRRLVLITCTGGVGAERRFGVWRRTTATAHGSGGVRQNRGSRSGDVLRAICLASFGILAVDVLPPAAEPRRELKLEAEPVGGDPLAFGLAAPVVTAPPVAGLRWDSRPGPLRSHR